MFMFNNYESIAEANKLEHDYDRIYDMFDLLRILRIKLLWIPDEALITAPSTTTINR
jgi:hypothetical protein